MTAPKDGAISGDFSPELVPVVEPGAGTLALPLLANAYTEIAFDDLLSDSLFGEVIDISDLVPRFLSPSTDAALQPFTNAELIADATATGFGGLGAGDDAGASGHATMLTILYDDDLLAWDSPIL